MNRHQRRAQAAIARKKAAAAAEKQQEKRTTIRGRGRSAHRQPDGPQPDKEVDDENAAPALNIAAIDDCADTDAKTNENAKISRQEARKAASKAALRRALLAMMTEYAQDHYGAWWITNLDRVLRNRLHDGFATIEPDLMALGIIRDAAAGWWRWADDGAEPVFWADTKPTRAIPRKPIDRRQRRVATGAPEVASEGTAQNTGAKEERKKSAIAARQAEALVFKDALKRGLRALMSDYCQERFQGAWWMGNLDDVLRRRLRAGNARHDIDLADIGTLRNWCRGWWTWPPGAVEPIFCEDEKRQKADIPAVSVGNAVPSDNICLRPIPPNVTRRQYVRTLSKRRPAGVLARHRPQVLIQ
jgi:hypothetical protein